MSVVAYVFSSPDLVSTCSFDKVVTHCKPEYLVFCHLDSLLLCLSNVEHFQLVIFVVSSAGEKEILSVVSSGRRLVLELSEPHENLPVCLMNALLLFDIWSLDHAPYALSNHSWPPADTRPTKLPLTFSKWF